MSPGKNNTGNLLLIATAAAVTILVEPGPTELVTTKIFFLLFALGIVFSVQVFSVFF